MEKNEKDFEEKFEGRVIIDGNNLKYISTDEVSSTCIIKELSDKNIINHKFTGKFNPLLSYPYFESGTYTKKINNIDCEVIFESEKFDNIFPDMNGNKIKKFIKINGEVKEIYMGGIKNNKRDSHGVYFKGTVDKKNNPVQGIQYVGNFDEDKENGEGEERYIENGKYSFSKKGLFNLGIFKNGIVEHKKNNFYFRAFAEVKGDNLIFNLKNCILKKDFLSYNGSLNSDYVYDGNGKEIRKNVSGKEIEILEGKFSEGRLIDGVWINKLRGFERKGKFIYNEKGERFLNDDNGEIILFDRDTNEIQKLSGVINKNKPCGYVKIEKLDKENELTSEDKKYYDGEVVKWNSIITNVKFYYSEYFKN